jgi:hypothetical protein
MRRILAVVLGSVALAGLGTTALASAHPATPPRPAASATVAPTTRPLIEPMTVTPATVAPGGSVAVSGTHCAAGLPVYIAIGGPDKPRELTTLTADGTGAFAGSVRIPDLPSGTTTLWAACRAPNPTGKLLHNAALTITG